MTSNGCGGKEVSTASVTGLERLVKGESSARGVSSSSKYWKSELPNIFCHSGELKSGKFMTEEETVANQSSKTT